MSIWVAAVLAVAAIQTACLTGPPPDLPVSQHRPTILRGEVVPPADVPLVEWPVDNTFIAEVEVDQGESFEWAAFLDYNPGNPSDPFDSALSVSAKVGETAAQVSFVKPMPVDQICHRIDLIVASSWAPGGAISPSYFYSPAGLGGDIVTWWYTGGLGISDCSPYSTSALPDGGFLPPDASSDGPTAVTE